MPTVAFQTRDLTARLRNFSLALGTGALLLGCSGSDKAEVADDKAANPTTPPAVTASLTFASVKPIIDANCVNCHGAEKPANGLDLTTYAGMMKGGKEHPNEAIIPGSPERSELIHYIKGTETPRMPMKADPLSDADIKLIEDWVKQGAKES